MAFNIFKKFSKRAQEKQFEDLRCRLLCVNEKINVPAIGARTAELNRELTDKELTALLNRPDIVEANKAHAHLLTENVAVALNYMDSGVKPAVLVMGNAGTGKTMQCIAPNIELANGSYVITDNGGVLLQRYGSYLEERGYDVRVLDLTNHKQSLRFNPLKYVKTEVDAECLAKELAAVIEPEDRFKRDTIAILLGACIGYLVATQPVEKRTLRNLLSLMNTYSQNGKLERLFEDFHITRSNTETFKKYKIWMLGSEELKEATMLSAALGLARFIHNNDFVNLTYQDELNLEDFADPEKKIAFFIVMREVGKYNWLGGTALRCVCNSIHHDRSYRTPLQKIRFLLDDCAYVSPTFVLNYFYSYYRFGASFMFSFRTVDELKKVERDTWEEIIDCFDTVMITGTSNISTVDFFVQRFNVDMKRISTMPTDESLLFIRHLGDGMLPVIQDKKIAIKPIVASYNKLSALEYDAEAIKKTNVDF